jgi:hypothetical protein
MVREDAIKMKIKITTHNAMKKYGGVEVQLHAFLTSALYGGEWSDSRAGRFTTHKKGCQYSLGRGLDGPQSRSGSSNKGKVVPVL